MQLDIFYNELNYHTVEQKKAFEFESFLGEVGGFLGLLLGMCIPSISSQASVRAKMSHHSENSVMIPRIRRHVSKTECNFILKKLTCYSAYHKTMK